MNASALSAIVITCLSAALLLGGCARTAESRLYEGNTRAPAEIAVLWCPMLLDPIGMDGKSLGDVAGFLPVETHYRFELLPGRHEFIVRYSGVSGGPRGQQEMLYSDPVPIVFEARAGRQYQAVFKQPEDDIRFVKTITNLSAAVEDITDNPKALEKWGEKPIVAQAEPAVTPAPANAQTTKPAPSILAPNTLEQLKLSWKQASEPQRAEFMRWTVSRPSSGLEPDPRKQNAFDQLKHWWVRASENEQGDFLSWSVSNN